jgi:Tol biopolymer transport system component
MTRTNPQVVTILGLERGHVREIRPRVSSIRALAWMPGERALVASVAGDRGAGPQLVQLDLETAAVTPLLSRSRGLPTFSSDGRWMYFTASESNNTWLTRTDRSRIVARDLATGEERVVYTPPDGYVVFGSGASRPLYRFRLTQDGQWLVLPIADGDQFRFTHMRLVRVPLAGGPTHEVFAPAPGDTLVGFTILGISPDQRDVILSRGKRFSGPWSLWRVPLAGGPAEMIAGVPPGFGALALTPDGKRLVFPKSTMDATELWVLEHPVLRGGGNPARTPAW